MIVFAIVFGAIVFGAIVFGAIVGGAETNRGTCSGMTSRASLA